MGAEAKKKIRWSPKSAEDLEAIFLFIARDSEHAAHAVASEIVDAINKISDFPFSGRAVPEFNKKSLRERIWKSYRIIYRVRAEIIEIVTISHGSKLLP